MLALQLGFNALVLGAAYALVALGFVLILNATGAVNFSQGELVMAGGFAGVALAAWLPAPGIVLLPLLLVAMAALGALVALVAYVPLRDRPPEAAFISTIAVGIVLQNAATLLFGPEPRLPPALAGGGQWSLGGLAVPYQSAAILLVASVLILSLHVLFRTTQLGRRLRATAQDREIASAIGIPVNRMIVATFALSAALAGTAGLLLGRVFLVSPTDGGNTMLKAYIAAVIGGWGSVPGAVLGAMLIALFEVVFPALPAVLPGLAGVAGLFSQTVSTIVLDLAILLILVVRPQGLFGEAVRTRA